MLEEVLCFGFMGANYRIFHDGVLIPFGEVTEEAHIPLAFYNPDDPLHCQQAKVLQERDVHLVAMVSVNDKRQLPEDARAMICCDDAKLVSQIIAGCLTMNDDGILCIYLPYLLGMLVGVVHYQRFTAMGDDRVHLIGNQVKNIVPKVHNVFGLIRAKALKMQDSGDFANYLPLDLESCEFALKENESIQDDMVIDLFYSLA